MNKSKYFPLTSYLEASQQNFIPMTFGEIERLLGFSLPSSSQNHRAWWSNNASNNVMTKAWLKAGYITKDVDLEGRSLVFSHESETTFYELPSKASSSNLPRKRDYTLFTNYLEACRQNIISMTFRDIERILGVSLPPSARKHRTWWSNDKTHSQALAWLNAGYMTEKVDMECETLVCRRESRLNDFSSENRNNQQEKTKKMPFENPLFGCMKGTITIPDGVDLTEPADPEWSKIVDELIEEKHPQS